MFVLCVPMCRISDKKFNTYNWNEVGTPIKHRCRQE